MTIDKEKLKALAGAVQTANAAYLDDECNHALHEALIDADDRFMEAAAPEVVLALLADLDEARNGMKHSCAIRLKREIERLEGERDRLKAQVATLQSDANSWQSGYSAGRKSLAGHAEQWRKEAHRFNLENEALRKDAERYRWLRDRCGIVEYKAIAGSIGPGMLPSGEKLEMAIDAVMSKGEQP